MAPFRLLRYLATGLVGSAFLVAAGVARAAVTEPDGLQVPNLAADHIPSNNETDLQQFFTNWGEPIDAIADASPDPGVFSPMCDFSVEFLPCASGGSAGVAWYNVPSDPTAIPDKIFQLLPPMNCFNFDAGTPVTSQSIRGNVNYAGGLIGFVLTDNGGPIGPDGTSRIYYSEPKRNVYCNGCATPGNWIMMLAYKSRLPQYPNSYYLAFEDWYTTTSTSRGLSDCDFNDKIFRISGIQCQGGGTPCDTGLLGVCKPGLTECTIGTTLVCRPQVPKSAERCDNVDNDCDGVVDNGDNLCPKPGDVCVNGNCVGGCSQTEFPCPGNLVCNGNYCVEPACVSVTCDPGLVCRGGQCVDACSGVVCPLGQLCETGICVDPCKNVTCDAGTVCANGACVAACGCAGCPAGKVCKADGSCVDSGCESQTCASGQVCVGGSCADACKNAACPGGAACTQGQCGTPSSSGAGGAANTTPVLGGGVGNNSTGSTTGNNNTGISAPGNGAGPNSTSSLGCGCKIAQSRTGSMGAIAVAIASLIVLRRRRTTAS